MFKSQVDFEEKMLKTAYDRAERILSRNEESGRAPNNAYANPILRRFVGALALSIKNDLDTPKPGPGRAVVGLLKPLEEEATAYIACRTILSFLMSNYEDDNGRDLFSILGRAIQGEMILRQYKNLDAERYYFLMQDLDRKHSEDVNHRLTVTKREMKSKGFAPIDWGRGNRDQVGAYLCDLLRILGFISVEQKERGHGKGRRSYFSVEFSPETFDLLKSLRQATVETLPYAVPCIEKPLPWNGCFGGGYHTEAMRRLYPQAVMGGLHGNGDVILGAINALQDVSWQINCRVLDVAKELSKETSFGEIVGPAKNNLPFKPPFLQHKQKDELSEEEQKEFKLWKKAQAEYYTQKKLDYQKQVSMLNLFTLGETFRNQDAIFFCYRADFRGRLYPIANGLSPQGSDLAKGLLQFSEAKPLDSLSAENYFLIHGANKFGYDKDDVPGRINWVKENHDMILAAADNPTIYLEWRRADKPFQFLAWCFEYADYCRQGKRFVSRIPVAMDGSCNGLQHFSAMLRDEIGGKAVNLMPSKKPADIYTDVARRTTELLEKMKEDEKGFRNRWLTHGIKRKLVKRSVMTLPYGSTRFSSRNFILEDYMRKEHMQEFDAKEFNEAATFLSNVVWEAIGSVVIAARQAMEWLQTLPARALEKHPFMEWETPTGFVVRQVYHEFDKDGKILVELHGRTQFRLARRSNRPCWRSHKNGIAPNFVHSMDAAHLHRTVLLAKKNGVHSLAMIHDDYGTHASDAAILNQMIREEFVAMYTEGDWLAKLAEKLAAMGLEIPPVPPTGRLSLDSVLSSQFFFL